jgi:hypothetical protein
MTGHTGAVLFTAVLLILSARLPAQVAGRALSSVSVMSQPSSGWTPVLRMAENTGIPLVDKMEMRSETDRLLYSRQEFLTRATFNGFGQQKAEKNKMRSFAIWKENERNGFWRPAILRTYRLLSDWHYSALELQLLDSERASLDREDSLYTRILQSGRETDLMDYLELKQEKMDCKIRYESAYNQWLKAAKLVGADTTMIAGDALWITPDKMVAITQSIPLTFNNDIIPEYNYLTSSAQLIRAENRRILDFVQARYTVRDDLLLQNRFTLGIGLLIPWRGSASLKLREISLRQEQLLEEGRADSTHIRLEFMQLRDAFFNHYSSWQKWKEAENDTSWQALKDKIVASGKADPIKILRLERKAMQRKAAEIRELKKIWDTYIDILHLSGVLYSRPLTNYLYGSNIPVFIGN